MFVTFAVYWTTGTRVRARCRCVTDGLVRRGCTVSARKITMLLYKTATARLVETERGGWFAIEGFGGVIELEDGKHAVDQLTLGPEACALALLVDVVADEGPHSATRPMKPASHGRRSRRRCASADARQRPRSVVDAGGKHRTWRSVTCIRRKAAGTVTPQVLDNAPTVLC